MPLVTMVVLVKEALTRSYEMRGTVLMPLVTMVVLVKEALTRSSEMRGTVLMPLVTMWCWSRKHLPGHLR